MSSRDRMARDGRQGDLRARAEEKAAGHASPARSPLGAPSVEESQRLVHELQVHQLELEMQNEELRRAQSELEASQAKYFELFDLAPVGYLLLNEEWLILEANLTAATLLGIERGRLLEQPVIRHVLPRTRKSGAGTPARSSVPANWWRGRCG